MVPVGCCCLFPPPSQITQSSDRFFSQRGFSPINTIILNNFKDTPDNLRRLLWAPSALRSFTFGPIIQHPGEPPRSWSLCTVVDSLRVQRASLTTLHLTALREPWQHLINFSEFEALTDLSVSYWSTGCRAGTERNFIAPRLKEFIWTFQPELPGEAESSLDFQQNQELWLRRFAETCLRQGVPLRRIHIQYNPADCAPRVTPRAERWPWEFMERLRGGLKDHGIQVTFAKPCSKPDKYLGMGDLEPLGN
jgi:hypothetical protein